jgi:hypothetical protein
MGTEGTETKHGTRQICGHPWNPWLKQFRPTENVEEPIFFVLKGAEEGERGGSVHFSAAFRKQAHYAIPWRESLLLPPP